MTIRKPRALVENKMRSDQFGSEDSVSDWVDAGRCPLDKKGERERYLKLGWSPS